MHITNDAITLVLIILIVGNIRKYHLYLNWELDRNILILNNHIYTQIKSNISEGLKQRD